MKEIKLALIGKDISHSRSREIYEALLNRVIKYDLLDYPSSDLIPDVSTFFKKYDGISITSPYKSHFLDEVELTSGAKNLSAINCLFKQDKKIFGANTDYLATKKIIHDLAKEKKVVILGDGAMVRVVKRALKNEEINFHQYARKTHGNISKLDFLGLGESALIINCCARDFIFEGKIDSKATFWDMNYSHPHEEIWSEKCNYVDGSDLLILQGKYALKLWGIVD